MIDALKMMNITKTFGSFQALKGVSFSIKKGEVHALLGANGAGKSTLMKILSGAYDTYDGIIEKNEQTISIRSPKNAKHYGLQMVHQEVDVALIPTLSVAENIMLNSQVAKKGFALMKWKHTYEQAKAALLRLGSSVDVKKEVGELSLSEKQQVLLARAIAQDVEYLILDEPTAPLSVEETKRLFEVIRKLKEQGVGIIYISHRLQEVFDIADRVTVLRDGEHIITTDTHKTSIDDVISHMLGKTFEGEFPKEDVSIGSPLMKVENLSWATKVSNVSFHVNEGEIVGIAGLVGAGKTELCRSLFGLQSGVTGHIHVRDKQLKVNKEPYYYIRHGISLVPEERRKEGILVEESITSNLTLPSLSQFTKLSFLLKEKEKAQALRTVQEVGVKSSSIKQQVGTLSGGNQQKVAIGKWLVKDADVYLFDEPTKGVDVGSKRDIFDLVKGLVKQGKGVVYATCEFNELLGIADRIYVIYNGEFVKELSRAEATHEQLFYYAAGGTEK
ncbi:sugar ABC transporter ATP-binding protein [Metabacillus iocasae]|uniref:Autoinducer 2 import ATP-binding protein LsrA n=1 Tax=Priestia iocasae TaxID=2291674 RepID=A0ABS2R180_9BACI|nr:sugar ABC transporter ATP-binding protein [Metabacillus iocasae]MBM7704761.1 simple sugar transport system ATP-binding protein [Metabacillus iocasae]